MAAQSLPALGDRVSSIVSREQESAFGDFLYRVLHAQAPLVYDPLLNEYVEHLAYRLASVSQLKQPDLKLAIIDTKGVNAFAGPGGVIGINTGLFLASESEDELAAVIAHEIAHLSQRHAARTKENYDQTRWVNIAAAIIGLALLTSGEENAGIATLSTASIATLKKQRGFSRLHEYEADRIGIKTLAKAGFDPYAMPRFFNRLASQNRFAGDTPFEFLRTHPVTRDRIADSLGKAERIEPANTARDPLEFRLMQSRIIAKYAKTPQDAVASFKAQLNAKATEQDPAIEYGLAISLGRDSQHKAANKLLNALSTNSPNRIAYQLELGENLLKSQEVKAAIELLRSQLNLNPGNYSLSIGLAKALVETGEGKETIELLRPMVNARPFSVPGWALLREAYHLTKNQVGVHLTDAELLKIKGETERSTSQLEHALRLVPQSDMLMTQKIQSKLLSLKASEQQPRF